MSTTTCEICGKPDCPTVEVNGQKIVGCDRCCPDPMSPHIMLGKGFKVSTTTYAQIKKLSRTQKIIRIDKNYPNSTLFAVQAENSAIEMAELLERAASYIKQGKIKFTPNTTNSDVDVWLADFERFQKGEG